MCLEFRSRRRHRHQAAWTPAVLQRGPTDGRTDWQTDRRTSGHGWQLIWPCGTVSELPNDLRSLQKDVCWASLDRNTPVTYLTTGATYRLLLQFDIAWVCVVRSLRTIAFRFTLQGRTRYLIISLLHQLQYTIVSQSSKSTERHCYHISFI